MGLRNGDPDVLASWNVSAGLGPGANWLGLSLVLMKITVVPLVGAAVFLFLKRPRDKDW